MKIKNKMPQMIRPLEANKMTIPIKVGRKRKRSKRKKSNSPKRNKFRSSRQMIIILLI